MLTEEELMKRARREYSKRYREENKEKINEYYRNYREKNREKIREINRRHWLKKAQEMGIGSK